MRILGYGSYAMSFALAASAGAFANLTSFAPLNDGRTGGGTTFAWPTTTQTTSVWAQITVTLGSDFADSPAVQGVVAICNCSLPAGTKIVVSQAGANPITQRLVAGNRGERNIYVFPQQASNTLTIQIFNDVNGSAALASGQVFSIGEIYCGRAMSLPIASDSPYMARDLTDQTMYQRAAGAQLYAGMRKPWVGPVTFNVGPFTTAQARGGTTYSNLYNGNLSTGVIDVQALRDYLSTSPICFICEVPSLGLSTAAKVGAGNLQYDINVVQTNGLLAKITPPGIITQDKGSTMWSWYPTAVEAC